MVIDEHFLHDVFSLKNMVKNMQMEVDMGPLNELMTTASVLQAPVFRRLFRSLNLRLRLRVRGRKGRSERNEQLQRYGK